MRKMTSVTLTATLAAVLVAAPLFAQGQQTVRVAGKIERVEGPSLMVKTVDAEREVRLAADTTIFALSKATVADIKPNSYLGVGATPQPDGSQKAMRVMIFPEAMRGVGEGHRPWDKPGTTMTNATVDNTVASVNGQVVMVKYKGGEQKIVVEPSAAIITFLPGNREELKVGASVAVNGIAKTATVVEATRVVVGRDGLVP